MPWLLLVLTPMAAVFALSSRVDDVDEAPAVLRWTALLGATLLIVLWASSG